MAEPHWTGYVGMAAGIVGSVTGIAGAVMGYISYRRSNSIKALDLRLELRKTVTQIESDLAKMQNQLEHANKSRQNVAAAKGMKNSGAMMVWNKAFEEDKNKLQVLQENALPSTANYNDLSLVELESRLVDIHKLRGQIDDLANKYNSSLKLDDEDRKRILETVRFNNPPRNV